jgi:hypothetical protein
VLDALAADDLGGLVASQVLARTTLRVKARSRIDAELARTVRKGENIQAPEHDGLKPMRSWPRGHARLSAREAHRLVSNGRALEQLPAVAAGFAVGVVTAEQVAVVTPVAAVTGLEAQAEAVGQGVELAAVDATLAAVAATQVHAQLGRVVAHFLARLDPDGTDPDPTEGRSLTLSKHADGRLSIHGALDAVGLDAVGLDAVGLDAVGLDAVGLDAVGGEKLCAVLESMVPASRPAGDRRTRAQQRGTPSCSGPATGWPRVGGRSCARCNRAWWSPSRWPTWPTPPSALRPPRWASAR